MRFTILGCATGSVVVLPPSTINCAVVRERELLTYLLTVCIYVQYVCMFCSVLSRVLPSRYVSGKNTIFFPVFVFFFFFPGMFYHNSVSK